MEEEAEEDEDEDSAKSEANLEMEAVTLADNSGCVVTELDASYLIE